MSRVDTPAPPDPSSGAMGGGVRQMAGDTGDATPSPVPQVDPSQMLAQATSTIRQADQSITDLAQQFPQAAREVRRARTALRSLLQKIVSEPGGGSPQAPQGEI
jgi:hypothetical protein